MDITSELSSLDVVNAAKFLLGQHLVRKIGKQQLIGRIVETEVYHQTDPASHSYRGQTNRTKVMFGPPGHAYVYFTYGMHYCFNVTAGPAGEGAAVLIRAIEPIHGAESMLKNRSTKPMSRTLLDIKNVANGPAKLTQALKIGPELNGHELNKPPLEILAGNNIPKYQIATTTRIGISAAVEKLWRFYIKDNAFVSKP